MADIYSATNKTPLEYAKGLVIESAANGYSKVAPGVTPSPVDNMDISVATKILNIRQSEIDEYRQTHNPRGAGATATTTPPTTHTVDAVNYATVEVDKATAVDIDELENDEDLQPLTITSLLDTVKSTPQVPLAIVGDAGTGKTSIIRQWAKDNGYELNLFLANTASEDDVAGAISPDHTRKLAVSYPLEKLHRSTTTKTVLFLDELNTARREVQDPLLTLIQDRTLPNGEPLHEDTIIVTAINPSATYNNHELSPQLRNRFMWHYHKPNEQAWVNWVKTTQLGDSEGAKMFAEMVRDGTLMFDKDEAFTEERNEFTTPRSVYNLLLISEGKEASVKRLAETLVSKPIAEAIRLHGYKDKDSKANTFFNERDKVEGTTATTATTDATSALGGTSTTATEDALTAQLKTRMSLEASV